MLDFSKAFDTVAHNKLLLKLEHYGIQSNTHSWLQTWLTKRTQKEGETSKTLKVLSGIPQGTVLGPLMFSLYINDISTGISSSIRLFADDCVLYRIITTEDHDHLQQDLNTLVEWTKQIDPGTTFQSFADFSDYCLVNLWTSTRGSHFHRSSVCTWCRDQNVIKGSSMKLQGNQKIKDRMNRRSSDQDIKSTLENYFRFSTLAM